MMPLTTKGRYAARIMVQLARLERGALLTKYDLGKLEDLSANYVEQIMILLRGGDLVRSHRGRRGGFSLMRDPSEITFADILHAVEGPVTLSPCLHGSCDRNAKCRTRPLWQKTANAVEKILKETTLAEVARTERPEHAEALSYQI